MAQSHGSECDSYRSQACIVKNAPASLVHYHTRQMLSAFGVGANLIISSVHLCEYRHIRDTHHKLTSGAPSDEGAWCHHEDDG